MGKNRGLGTMRFGAYLSVIGAIVVALSQVSTTTSWSVEAACVPSEQAVTGSVSDDAGHHEIDVFVTYHVPGSGTWTLVPGSGQHLSVDGPGPHAFGPLDVSATPSSANAIRVEIEVQGSATNAKSDSFAPCGGSTPTATLTATLAASSTPTEVVSTATSIPTATSTRVVSDGTPTVIPTATTPTSTATTPPAPTATEGARLIAEILQASPVAPQPQPPGSFPKAGSGGYLAEQGSGLNTFGVFLAAAGLALALSALVWQARSLAARPTAAALLRQDLGGFSSPREPFGSGSQATRWLPSPASDGAVLQARRHAHASGGFEGRLTAEDALRFQRRLGELQSGLDDLRVLLARNGRRA